MTCIAYVALQQVLRRGKPSFLIKLAVVGQICLGHNAQYLPLLYHYSAVEQQVACHYGCSYNGDDVELACKVEQHHYALLCHLQEEVLAEEVLTTVTCDRKLWEDDDFHTLALCLQTKRHISCAFHALLLGHFNQLSASEYRLVQQLVRDIRLPLPSYRSRRTQLRPSGASVHWPASLKAAARTGGELASLRWRRRRKLPMPWLALVDVSGSMERYARLLLAFLHQASSPQRYPKLRRHVYSVGSSLRDLNSAFALSDPDAMLLRASSDIDDFGGGTRLGECLAQLRRQAGRHLVGRRTLVLLISDGLDTGEPQQLEQELQWIRRHSARLVWLNPLLRFEGYAPLAQGAGVLHRHSDAMLAVHNLESLQQLAIHLARLLQTPAASHG